MYCRSERLKVAFVEDLFKNIKPTSLDVGLFTVRCHLLLFLHDI